MCAECLEEKHAGVVYGLHLGDYEYRYIGKSVNHRKRFRDHKSDALLGGGYAVHRWIRKHGDAVQMTILETFTPEDIHYIDEREIFHIAQARWFFKDNLNLTDGGDGQMGRPCSDATRAKLSAARTGTKRSPETNALIIAALTGRVTSPETRAKQSASNTGKIRSAETRARISLAMRPGLSNHTRYHTNRNMTKADCIYCTEGGTQ